MSWICRACLSINREPLAACACGRGEPLVRSAAAEPLGAEERVATFRRARLEALILPAVQAFLERAEEGAAERLDLVRSLVFARALAGYCRDHGIGEADPVLVRYAVALQPLGRATLAGRAGLRVARGRGALRAAPGGWREASATIACRWLALEGAPADLCAGVAALAGPTPPCSLEARVARDAALLNRLRPGHQRPFDLSLLGFGRDAEGHLLDAGAHEGARMELVREAHLLIEATAPLGRDPGFRAGGSCLARLEDVVIDGAARWPLLAAGWMAPEPRPLERSELVLQLADEEGDPKAGWRFSLRCGGAVADGFTNASGVLSAQVPPGAESAELRLWPPGLGGEGEAEVWTVDLRGAG